MIIKAFEVRDKATFVPVLAVQMTPDLAPMAMIRDLPSRLDELSIDLVAFFRGRDAEGYLLRRCGYPTAPPYAVLLTRLDSLSRATVNPYDWGDRTFQVAHFYITEHFDELEDGAMVDVEFILGETAAPKRSEREEYPI